MVSRHPSQHHRGLALTKTRIFIINGAISVVFALCCTFVIPDFPRTTKWLTEEQRAFAAWRLRMDAEEDDDSHATGLMQGLKLCLKDWRLYVFALMLHSNILCGTFQYIFPSIVQTLGFPRIQTLLLTVSRFDCWPQSVAADIVSRSRSGSLLGLSPALSRGARIVPVIGHTTSLPARSCRRLETYALQRLATLVSASLGCSW